MQNNVIFNEIETNVLLNAIGFVLDSAESSDIENLTAHLNVSNFLMKFVDENRQNLEDSSESKNYTLTGEYSNLIKYLKDTSEQVFNPREIAERFEVTPSYVVTSIRNFRPDAKILGVRTLQRYDVSLKNAIFEDFRNNPNKPFEYFLNKYPSINVNTLKRWSGDAFSNRGLSKKLIKSQLDKKTREQIKHLASSGVSADGIVKMVDVERRIASYYVHQYGPVKSQLVS